MKKYLIITTLILSLFDLYPQSSKNNSHLSAFLSDSCVHLYCNAVGNSHIFLITNTNKDFYLISLIKKSSNRYFVSIENISSDDAITWYGWICRYAVGITFSSNTIELFNHPLDKSKSMLLTIPLGSIIANVLDYKKNGWMKVSFYFNEKFYIGWIPQQYQCYNYYTMCCGT